MHVSKLLGSLFADSIAISVDTTISPKKFIELPVTQEFIEECSEYLKSQEDYKEFKLTVFKYLSSKKKAFKSSKTFKKHYPELSI